MSSPITHQPVSRTPEPKPIRTGTKTNQNNRAFTSTNWPCQNTHTHWSLAPPPNSWSFANVFMFALPACTIRSGEWSIIFRAISRQPEPRPIDKKAFNADWTPPPRAAVRSYAQWDILYAGTLHAGRLLNGAVPQSLTFAIAQVGLRLWPAGVWRATQQPYNDAAAGQQEKKQHTPTAFARVINISIKTASRRERGTAERSRWNLSTPNGTTGAGQGTRGWPPA